MAILLCSTDEMVRRRWQDLLSDKQTFQAETVAELKARVSEKDMDLLLLHRTMIDMQTTAELRRIAPNCKICLLTDRPTEEEGIA